LNLKKLTVKNEIAFSPSADKLREKAEKTGKAVRRAGHSPDFSWKMQGIEAIG
jgi:hypothetical protein